MVQFRKSKNVGPFRFTMTNRGLSTSVGAGPLRISKGADGKVRRTVRVPGVGLYDTKVVGRPKASSGTQPPVAATAASSLPAPGWYPDPAGSPGRSYWNGQAWGPQPPKPPFERRGMIIGGGVLGFILLLILLGNCSGSDTQSVSSTVTRTVTATAPPSTVTVTAPPPSSVVTVTEQAVPPPQSTTTVTETQAAQAPGFYQPPETNPALPPSAASAYYGSCADARAAGAAPLYVGEPGYRSGLDRDGDGVACEG